MTQVQLDVQQRALLRLGLDDFDEVGVANTIRDFTRAAAEAKRTLEKAAAAKAESDTAMAVAQSGPVQTLARQLGWSSMPALSAGMVYGWLQARLQSGVVGLGPVRAFVSTLFADAVGRYALAEDLRPRHVLIDGDFGAGKRTGAGLVAMATHVLWLGQDKKPNSNTTNAVHSEPHKYLVEANSLEDITDNIGIKTRTVYYVRVGAGSVKPCNKRDGPILTEIEENDSIVIFAGEKKYMNAIASTIGVSKKRIALPTVSAEDLAQITARLARQRGYRLLRHDEGNARSLAKIAEAAALETDVRVMRFIISQRYSDDAIRDRNTHLAQDMVDQAIVRKSERMMRTRGTGTPAAATATGTAASSGGGSFSFVQTATTSKADHFGQMVLTLVVG
jgi:hypothetical protein